MKLLLIILISGGILSFLFGCKHETIQKESLYGDWEAIKLYDEPIINRGFTSIKLKISPDSIQITTQTKSFGEITTISQGYWELTSSKTFKSKMGDKNRESHLKIHRGNLVFSPDPLFNPEIVVKSEYKKIQ